ncbi:MAG: IS5/IS1182 family transposase, partial [Nitrospirota bacterium]
NLYKHFRGLATRYDKRADSYKALWIIAAIFLWLK